MADSAVQIAIELLNLLINEAYKISSLPDDVRAISNELRSISAFLKRAEERAEEDDTVKEWVRQVRILAYDIEDVIEEYQLSHKETTSGKFMQFLSWQRMATTIKSLRERAIKIGKMRDSYSSHGNVFEQGNCSSQDTQLTISSLCVAEEFEFVGAEIPKAEIIELLEVQELNSRISTVAVVGMRGLGKTTIVGSIYNDAMVRDYFPIRAWVAVSQPYKKEDILKNIMKQFYEAVREHEQLYRGACSSSHHVLYNESTETNNVDQMDERSLIDRLKRFLEDKRYMVVFDDVQDGELATFVKHALPTGRQGSKILITSRNETVARAWLDEPNHDPYKLKPLLAQEAWELFCKKTFQSYGGTCPQWLHDEARGIVNKCEGVPLIILAIGRLLSSKPDDLHEWEKVHHSLGFYLQRNHQLTAIHKILIRSYYDLPYYLKACFLYFGLFPRGYPIQWMRLIRLWIAEGFIRENSGILTLEDVAEMYLNELVDMNLVEVERRDAAGKPRTLRVHEFLHEIILSKLEELSFCQISGKKSSNVEEKPRRLSIHMGCDHSSECAYDEVLEGIIKSRSNIRCLFLIHPTKKILSKVLTKAFLSNIPLLRVLDLCNALIDVIPKEVERLCNLHYLSLRNTRVRSLPSSIGKLLNLQTLDLKHTRIQELPNDINKLKKLRHLLTYCYEYDYRVSYHTQKVRGMNIPKRALEEFGELQKLAFVDVGHGAWLMKGLKNLRHLRKLGITELKLEDGRDLCAAIKEMKYLQAFSVFSKNLIETIDLEHLQSQPLNLKRLYLSGPLKSFPYWMFGHPSLVKIRLRWSRLHVDPLEILQSLPNLVELQLLEAYEGENLRIGNEGFKKLKILHLLDLHGLKSLIISKGALPILEEMAIGESPGLDLPPGIHCLLGLKTLNFFNMPRDFASKLQPKNGPYYSIVKHVPNVCFQEKDAQGNWQTYTLR